MLKIALLREQIYQYDDYETEFYGSGLLTERCDGASAYFPAEVFCTIQTLNRAAHDFQPSPGIDVMAAAYYLQSEEEIVKQFNFCYNFNFNLYKRIQILCF